MKKTLKNNGTMKSGFATIELPVILAFLLILTAMIVSGVRLCQQWNKKHTDTKIEAVSDGVKIAPTKTDK